MKINSRAKGARGERQWRDELRARGYAVIGVAERSAPQERAELSVFRFAGTGLGTTGEAPLLAAILQALLAEKGVFL